MTAAAMLFPLAVATYFGMSQNLLPFREHFAKEPTQPLSSKPVCQFLDKHTSRWDSVYVWGFNAEVYLSCARSPASRYVYSTIPAGVVPWFDSTLTEENARAAPNSRSLLIRDLEETKPEVILEDTRSILNREMRRYPEFGLYLDAHYCADEPVDGLNVYLRKPLLQKCPLAAEAPEPPIVVKAENPWDRRSPTTSISAARPRQ